MQRRRTMLAGLVRRPLSRKSFVELLEVILSPCRVPGQPLPTLVHTDRILEERKDSRVEALASRTAQILQALADLVRNAADCKLSAHARSVAGQSLLEVSTRC